VQKICIIGSPGSGKSTLAKNIGSLLDVEVIHMDTLFWKPNWVASSMDELADAQALHVGKDRWVIEGNYSKIWRSRFETADTIIFLDIPRYVCFYRVLKRFWQNRNQTRSDIGKDCPEKIDLEFLWFVWTYPSKRRWKAVQVIEEHSLEKETIILYNNNEVANFINKISYLTANIP
jgi:adenylate kinase family enzyme